jgi:hypothetical protein
VTSPGSTDTSPFDTLLANAALIALVTAGPLELRSSKSLNTSATAPESAPASAEFCA